MPRIVALLRGVNLGGRRRVAMADLRALLEGLGYEDVRTHLQSGNAVLTTGDPAAKVARDVEAAIAERMGLDDETIQAIHVSGLLHDVGKIGIPDQVLRKPGRLTAQELDVISQHVVLGEMIVRDLPDIDRVREGIKYHHEW